MEKSVVPFLTILIVVFLLYLPKNVDSSGTVETCGQRTSSGVVGFNVGGRVFATTLTTLKIFGENFLSQLVEFDQSGIMKATKDKDGNYFIDRNGMYFEYVLDYLRTGTLFIELFVSRQRLDEELAFYGIPLPAPSPGAELDSIYHSLDANISEIVDQVWPALNKVLKEQAQNGKIAVDIVSFCSRCHRTSSNICDDGYRLEVPPNMSEYWHRITKVTLFCTIQYDQDSPSSLFRFQRLLVEKHGLNARLFSRNNAWQRPGIIRIFLGPDYIKYLDKFFQ